MPYLWETKMLLRAQHNLKQLQQCKELKHLRANEFEIGKLSVK